MKILIGLGNPGKKYKMNRHNIGFLVIEKIAELYGTNTRQNKFDGLITECGINNQRIFLFKPTTFMNNSGHAVSKIAKFYKVESKYLIVFHDDLDLQFGQIKIKRDGGHAGHNGIRSIHNFIGQKYARVRIGIGHPGEKSKVAPYVLSDFHKHEYLVLEQNKCIPLGKFFLQQKGD